MALQEETYMPAHGGLNQEKSVTLSRGDAVRLGISIAFLAGVAIFANLHLGLNSGGGSFLMVAAIVGGYMALNIGANDVANNVGPTVGSGALTLTTAIILAAIFEVSGALLAGGDVVSTIKKGIIDPALIADSSTFVWLMLAALFAAAVWLNIATYFGAPVSTTHSIVGGVLGAGIAAGGWQIANWDKLGTIAASWFISPVLGGLIAAAILYGITRLVIDQKDLMRAARTYVPYILALMAWAFSTYLALKGLKKIWHVDFATAGLLGFFTAVLVFVGSKPMILRASLRQSNGRDGLNELFTVPLIFSAALLSFAHGANDVANAVGPLAAISDTLVNGGVSSKAAIPIWVMIIGALGIAVGLALFGPKLIRTVGSEITHLDKTRAFCVAISAAITVIAASQMGLPVSSTHIAVGGVFGVGFLREYLNAYRDRTAYEIQARIQGADADAVAVFLEKFKTSALVEQEAMVRDLKENGCRKLHLAKKDRKTLLKSYRKELVKRSMLVKIAAAWVITVPASGLLAAIMYYTIRGVMLP